MIVNIFLISMTFVNKNKDPEHMMTFTQNKIKYTDIYKKQYITEFFLQFLFSQLKKQVTDLFQQIVNSSK